MGNPRRLILMVLLAACSLPLVGCLVEVKKYEGDAQALFAEAEKDLQGALQDPDRKKAVPDDLHILVYEKDSHDLVRLKIPFWLLSKIDDKQVNLEVPEEFKDRSWVNRDKIHLTLAELKKMGPGIVLKVNDDDSRVMVWLK